MVKKDSLEQEQIDLALNDFGEFVKRNRRSRGLTFEMLAERTNLSSSYIFRIENNHRKGILTSKINIMINGFDMDLETVMAYVKEVILSTEALKGVTN